MGHQQRDDLIPLFGRDLDAPHDHKFGHDDLLPDG